MKPAWFGPNHYYIEYDKETSEALKATLFSSVFPEDKCFPRGQKTSALSNVVEGRENWRSVPLPGDVFECYRVKKIEDVSDDLFDQLPPGLYEMWEEAHIGEDALQPLFDMIVESGCREILCVPIDITGKEGDVIGIFPVRSFLCLMEKSLGGLGIYDAAYLTTKEATWGIYSERPFVGMLSAAPAFFQDFLEKSGGEEAYRGRVDRFALGESYLIGDTVYEIPRDDLRPVYNEVGWTFPGDQS